MPWVARTAERDNAAGCWAGQPSALRGVSRRTPPRRLARELVVCAGAPAPAHTTNSRAGRKCKGTSETELQHEGRGEDGEEHRHREDKEDERHEHPDLLAAGRLEQVAAGELTGVLRLCA